MIKQENIINDYGVEDIGLKANAYIAETPEMLTVVTDAMIKLGYDKAPSEILTEGWSSYSLTAPKREIYRNIRQQIANFNDIFKGDVSDKRFHQTIRKVSLRMMIQQGIELNAKAAQQAVLAIQNGLNNNISQEEKQELQQAMKELKSIMQDKVNKVEQRLEEAIITNENAVEHIEAELNEVQSTLKLVRATQQILFNQIMQQLQQHEEDIFRNAEELRAQRKELLKQKNMILQSDKTLKQQVEELAQQRVLVAEYVAELNIWNDTLRSTVDRAYKLEQQVNQLNDKLRQAEQREKDMKLQWIADKSILNGKISLVENQHMIDMMNIKEKINKK